MTNIITARWADWVGEGLQHLVLREGTDGFVAEAVVLAGDREAAFASYFRIECDRAWQTVRVEVDVVGQDRRIELLHDGRGRWCEVSGKALPELDGAIDVDLPITPFTNTLPIRRLQLAEGESASIGVVYIDVPDMTVSLDRQQYTCVSRDRKYRYESIDTDFVREIEIGTDGLVISYPGLFRRTR